MPLGMDKYQTLTKSKYFEFNALKWENYYSGKYNFGTQSGTTLIKKQKENIN